MKRIKIHNKYLGESDPCFIVAEAGANANSDINLAKQLVIEAAGAGADAIKFQTYSSEKLATKKAPKYWVDTMKEWEENAKPTGYQHEEFELIDKLTKEDYIELSKLAKKEGIIFFSTPFDFEAVDFLEEIGVPMYKIASADITHFPLLEYIAKKGKPMILSTGASTLEEIRNAVKIVEDTGNKQIILLHCTLHYPTALRNANLAVMHFLKEKFPNYPIGLSDHTLGTIAPVIAAALGAKMIEKHYTIDKELDKSSDHFMSVDPKELTEMVNSIRAAELVIGSSEKKLLNEEIAAFKYARRSVVSKRLIKKGEIITKRDICFKRPGTGISPKDFKIVIGRKVEREIPADELISFNDLE